MKKFFSTFVFAITTFIATVPAVHATTTPSFPTCQNPQGTIIAQYADGIHGIVGDSATHQGSDVVYQINDDQVLQCFCPKENNNGIQTVWWKYSNLSEQDISQLERDGWIWVPTGRVWGLADAPYLAKNSSYSCGGVGGGSSTSSSSGTGGSTAQVLGITSLANTGNEYSRNALAFAITVSLLTFVLLRQRT